MKQVFQVGEGGIKCIKYCRETDLDEDTLSGLRLTGPPLRSLF